MLSNGYTSEAHMYGTILSLASLLLILFSSFSYACAQQVSKFHDLEKYLLKEMVGQEAVRVITDHLKRSGTDAPLDNLIAWAKAGFPDLQDENGYWKTESISFRLGIVRSLYFYLSTSPPADKSTRYLAVIDELQRDDYITYHLVDMAYRVVEEAVLEEKALKLLKEKNPTLREQGVRMGSTLAERKPFWFERYQQMLRNDDDAHVRTTILYSILRWPKRRDVAFMAFERLLNDTDANVRNLGARGIEIAAERDVLTADDLAPILLPMLKTNDTFVRVSIGRAAAQMATTDDILFVRSEKITDELLAGFINAIKARESTSGSPLSEADLTKAWFEWWTPLIPQYTRRLRLSH